ncbi:MAG: chemotaxis protein CheW [Gammaproteobacteria bacterium]|nr:chemotaxis protein CheW [Gammaproteobacteria bacterium]
MSEVSAQAWLLELSRNQVAAVGLHELLEVLSRPKLFHVPMASARCHHVLVWRDEILPVVDFGADRTSESDDAASGGAVTAIAVYQTVPGEPLRHGALLLNVMPKTVTVADNMACALPESHSSLSELAISCFSYENVAIPVIDLTRVFERVK